MAGLGCRFVTAFHALAHVTPISAGDRVAVYGCGDIGLSAIHIADALGATVVAVDIMDQKLSRSIELGTDETVNAADVENVPGRIRELTDGGVEISVDALGIAETFHNSVLGVRSSDDHVQIGLGSAENLEQVDFPVSSLIVDEISIHGAMGMQAARYDEIFRMVANDKLDPGLVVDRTIRLKEVSNVLAAMGDYGKGGITVVDEFA
jgi:alcohol dehydrogenase